MEIYYFQQLYKTQGFLAKLKDFFAKLKNFFAKLKEFFAKLNFSAFRGTRGGGKTSKKQAWPKHQLK